ncbi:MAG TPA: hypothetical protein VH600_12365 [Burkholderiales bacterium]|jgi:hypothetical protein
MNAAMTDSRLALENVRYAGSGAVSRENRRYGFRPAFMDLETAAVYLARFADGRPAPFHLLDGLPDELVLSRDAAGRVAEIRSSVISGFEQDGRFYTRDEAAQALSLASAFS